MFDKASIEAIELLKRIQSGQEHLKHGAALVMTSDNDGHKVRTLTHLQTISEAIDNCLKDICQDIYSTLDDSQQGSLDSIAEGFGAANFFKGE